jgi:hypothetical protein
MANGNSSSSLSVWQLIMVPALITLGITILRLLGELRHWSHALFNPAPGGGAALVGIVWLPIIFGPYFALKVSAAGPGPSSRGGAIGYALLGFVVLVAGVFLTFKAGFKAPLIETGGLACMAVAIVLQFRPWPALAKALVAYGYAARVPVAIIMFFAIRGNWGTHYDGPPPNLPELSFWAKYLQIALLPQLVFWVAFTVIIGGLFGAIAAAVRRTPVAAQ